MTFKKQKRKKRSNQSTWKILYNHSNRSRNLDLASKITKISLILRSQPRVDWVGSVSRRASKKARRKKREKKRKTNLRSGDAQTMTTRAEAKVGCFSNPCYLDTFRVCFHRRRIRTWPVCRRLATRTARISRPAPSCQRSWGPRTQPESEARWALSRRRWRCRRRCHVPTASSLNWSVFLFLIFILPSSAWRCFFMLADKNIPSCASLPAN